MSGTGEVAETTEQIMLKIINFQKFKTAYELGILTKEEFIKLAETCVK